eukprot:TRINITY_DN9938_c0_g1_i7.p1 TRINITY_DN9938_c0_g1~~TRINITY_DN9938_c0_g1_i7.p1  ORF type:complete len:109 (+),score=19.02 TRINITY_DN9938_c0_g1_i7:810-1136(+)
MIKVLINGYCGKMGKVIAKLIKEKEDITVVAGVDRQGGKTHGECEVFKNFGEVVIIPDVIIDFSNPDTLEEMLLSLIHISEPTRLLSISYAVFCLKKKKKKKKKKKQK